MSEDYFERFSSYEESFPLLQELCELDAKEVRDQMGYLAALYGMALGYLEGKHPADSFATMALACAMGLREITFSGWDQITLRIADTLEKRANE